MLVAGTCALVIASTYPLYRMSGVNFTPDEDESRFQVSVRLPVGSSLAATTSLMERMARDMAALATARMPCAASSSVSCSDGGSAVRRQNTSTAHLFFASPLRKGNLATLFSTHPPIDDRIAQAAGMSWDKSEAHSAIYDAEKTAELFCRIVNKWQELGGWPMVPDVPVQSEESDSEQA